jgi:CheY-like chemotaxis protein
MGASVGSLRLLVVEDHVDTAELLASLLQRRGHHVQIATTASEALRLASTMAFDVIVSDLRLPDASGYELMKQLRATTAVKGIAMSGWSRDEDLARSREAGFSAHLTKPVHVHQLEQTIRRVATE